MNLIEIISILLLIDSFFALFLSIFGEKWYIKNFRSVSRIFPTSKPWALWYFILSIWIVLITFKFI
jgi:hypothetical protein